jgi:hypothetical protein
MAKLGAPLRLIQPEGLEFYEFYVLDEMNVTWKAIVTAAKGTSVMEVATSLWDVGYKTISAPDGHVDRLIFFTLEIAKFKEESSCSRDPMHVDVETLKREEAKERKRSKNGR